MMGKRIFVSALVLAAGRGSRMGRTKQLLPIAGQPALAHVVLAALASVVDEVVVVLGYEAESIRNALADCWAAGERVRFVDNETFERGQSTSLAAGIAAVDARSEAVVVLLGDQPTVSSSDVDRVIAAFGADDVAAVRAVYITGDESVAGHPTLLGRVLWGEICGVRGDVGAREVLARHGERVLRVDLGKAPPPDLDNLDDYKALVSACSRRG